MGEREGRKGSLGVRGERGMARLGGEGPGAGRRRRRKRGSGEESHIL